MRILMLAEKFPPDIGGVASSAKRIANSLTTLNHDVHIVVLARELPGGRVVTSDHDGLTVHRFGRTKNIDFTLQQVSNFLDWLHQNHPLDLIWIHYLGALGFLGGWFGAAQSLPVITAIRGNDLDRSLFPPGDFARLEWSLRRATVVTTVTRQLAEKVELLVGRKACVLPNSVDTDLFAPGPADPELRREFQVGESELVLGFSGELRAKKGVGFLVELVRELLDCRPVRLLVIGEVRPKERAEYERTLGGSKELTSAVTITGHIAESARVAQIMRLFDVMVIPSLWDGMPNSLLEAMSCGIPVIASDAGGIPEVLQDGVNGMVVPRSHLHCLIDAVERWLSKDRLARDQILRAARKMVCERHSLAREREAIREIIQSIPSRIS